METARTLGPDAWRRCRPGCCCRESRRCRCAWTVTWPTRCEWREVPGRRSARGLGQLSRPRAGPQPSRYHDLARRYLPRGAGGILAFGLVPGSDGDAQRPASASSRRRSFMSHLANVGDARTLVIHPASTTHRQLDAMQQQAAGVTPDMVRLSVGLESIDDILWDIDQALAQPPPEGESARVIGSSSRLHSPAILAGQCGGHRYTRSLPMDTVIGRPARQAPAPTWHVPAISKCASPIDRMKSTRPCGCATGCSGTNSAPSCTAAQTRAECTWIGTSSTLIADT